MKTLLNFLLILVVNVAFSQQLMTIGEVFNYEVGDEFHTRGLMENGESVPPNADRVTIGEISYSSDGDTLFYTLYHDSYVTEMVWEPEPHLAYNFYTDTTTAVITQLDSSLIYYDNKFNEDTIVFYSQDLCALLVNGYSVSFGEFEPEVYTSHYAEGLGLTYSYYYSGTTHKVMYEQELFYYKKGEESCGIPDTTTVSIKEIPESLQGIILYPNPVKTRLFIENPIEEKILMQIYDMKGRLIDKKLLNEPLSMYDLKNFNKGVYLFRINKDGHTRNFRIVKE